MIQEIFSSFNKLCPEIIYYDDFSFDIPSEITFNEHEIGELTTEKVSNNEDWQQILNDILISLKPESNFIRDIVKWPSKDRNTADNRLQQMSNEINTVISNKWKDISKGKSAFSSISIDKLNSEYEKYTISIKSQNNTFKLHERSKGFKWFFAFLLLTEFRKHRKKNTIFLLDEPASNLHAAAQQRLTESLNNLCKGSTVIYSTHLPYLLDYNNINQIYLTKNEASEYEDPVVKCSLITQEIENDKSNQECIKPLLDHVSFSLPSILNQKSLKEKIKDKINDVSQFIKEYKEILPFLLKILSNLKEDN